MRTIALIAISLFFTSYARAYTEKAYTGSSPHMAGSDGDASQPLYDQNNSYFFCDTKEKFDKSRSGFFDWKGSSAAEYCRNSHAGRPNSWRDGWERSRLEAGCRQQIDMIGNHVYRCWDEMSDGGLDQIFADAQKREQDKYAAWKEAYKAKTAAGLNDAQPYMGSVQADVDAANAEKAAVEAAITKDNAEAQKIKTTLASLAKADVNFTSTVASRSNAARALEQDLSEAIVADTKDIQTVKGWLVSDYKIIMATDATKDSLELVAADYQIQAHSPEIGVCTASRSSVAIIPLRAHRSITSMIFDHYLTTLEAAKIGNPYKAANAAIDDSIAKLNANQATSNTIYSPKTEILTSKPAVCVQFLGIQPLISLRQEDAALKGTASALSNIGFTFRSRLHATQKKWAQQEYLYTQLRAISNASGRFLTLLAAGQLNEAKFTKMQAEVTLQSLLANPGNTELLSKGDIALLKAKAENALKAMQANANGRLTLVGGPALVTKRLASLQAQIYRVEDSLTTNAQDRNSWTQVIKPQILAQIGLVPDADLDTPGFRSDAEMLTFDAQIGKAEDVMRTYILSRGVKP